MSNNTYKQMGGNRASIDSVRLLIPCPEKFLKKFPDMKEEKAQKYFNRYLRVLSFHIIRRMPFLSKGRITISLERIFNQMGDFKYKSKRYYIWNEFKEIYPMFHLLDENDKGNNIKHELSQVTIMDHNHKYIQALIAGMDTEELVSIYYGDLTEDQYDQLDNIPIDLKSLNNFIKHCDIQLASPSSNKNEEYRDRVRKNRYQALYVKLISEFFAPAFNNVPTLPLIPTESAYGRIYYKGINPMNATKEVRRAIIGDYYQYDLNASVYAIKLLLAKDVCEELNVPYVGQFTYTKDYIDRKSKIRDQLVKECLIDMNIPEKAKIDIIKSAITSIGFGASMADSSWLEDGERQYPAIHEIIKNREDRERFIKHEFVSKFVKEQRELTNIIATHWLKSPEFAAKISSIKGMVSESGRFKNAKVMAYIFQHVETQIMQEVEKLVPNLVCRVHDALITKKPISNTNLLEIKHVLNEFSGSDTLSELTIDKEYYSAWTNPDHDNIEDDDPRDKFVRDMAKGYYKPFDGNLMAYDQKCQYGPLEPEDDYA